MWAQAAFTLPLTNGLTGATGWAVLKETSWVLALAGHALTTCGEAGAGDSIVAGALTLPEFPVGDWATALSPRILAPMGGLLYRLLRRHFSAELAFIRISMALSSVAAARTCWMTALWREGLRASGASSRMSGGVLWQTEGLASWLEILRRFGLSSV